jgi:hypothetical protein
MGTVIKKDFFLITLIIGVSKWYDAWYQGNIISMKRLHINTLLLYYDPSRFKNCSNLYEERMNFLSEVHDMVYLEIDIGGNEIWLV